MKPYGQKRNWVEVEEANKYRRCINKKGRSKKITKHWKKRERNIDNGNE